MPSAPEILFGPSPHKEAAAFIKSKPAVSRAVFGQMLPEIQGRAFTVSGIENIKVLQKLRDDIATIPAGGDWDQVKIRLADEISPWLTEGDTDEAKAEGRAAADRRAELLLRTHGYQAYAVSQKQVLDRQRDVFKYWRYQTAQDDQVREAHAALDGIVLPADDPFWQTHFPPWDFNCRCTIVALSDEDMIEIRAADAKRVYEERSILDDEQRAALNNSGFLIRGPNVNVDVRSPMQKSGGSGYAASPGTLAISLEELQARYDPEVFATFKQWAKAQKLPGGKKTVWAWLGGSTGEWPGLDEVKAVRKLGGTTGAELVKDLDGRQFVLKRGASPEHLLNEAAADAAYSILGAAVPRVRLFPGAAPAKIAEFIEGRTLRQFLAEAAPADQAAVLAQIRQHFVADALLANYDVAGLELDNILVDRAGKAWRIDNGGSFKYRAQGKLKSDFGPKVTELDTMRDRKVNPAAARVFAGVTEADIRAQVAAILPQREALLAAVPADVRATMAARLDDLAARFAPAVDQGDAAFAEAVQRSRIVGRATRWDKLEIEDTQVLFWQETNTAGARTLHAKLKLTEAGSAKIMERLKASLPAPPAGTTSDQYWPAIEKALKTVNKHAADGAYNAATLEQLAKTKAALQQLDLAGPNAGLKGHYLDIIQKIEAAQAAKSGTAKFAPWKFKPEEPAAGAGVSFKIERTRTSYTAKETRRGHAREQETKIYSHDAYVVDLDGTQVKLVPFKEAGGGSDFNSSYALRGYVEVAHPAEASAEAIAAVQRKLATIGLDTAAATDGYAELLYLRKGMQIRTDVFTPAKLRAADAVLADTDLSDAQKITRLKATIKKDLGLDLPDRAGPGYDWRARGNSFGEGWERTERWDLPRAQVERELPGWALHHTSSTPLDKLIDSILDGGGDFTATTERLRKGVSISSGMSPTADLDTGGANYLFSRIYNPAKAAANKGINLKIGNLARQDVFSFQGDRYGNVKTDEAYRVRAKTIEQFKDYARSGSNETILKYGVPLLDELDSVVVDSATMKKKVLAVFKKHGWEKLPDGRAIADLVKLRQ